MHIGSNKDAIKYLSKLDLVWHFLLLFSSLESYFEADYNYLNVQTDIQEGVICIGSFLTT